MNDPLSGEKNQEAGRRFLHGRHLRPLLTPLISCLIVATLVYLFEHKMPAFHEVVKLGYFIIAVVFVIATGRALRTREGRRRKGERRQGERRHSGGR